MRLNKDFMETPSDVSDRCSFQDQKYSKDGNDTIEPTADSNG